MTILYSHQASDEIDTARAEDRPVSDDAAQTIASWWYSPAQPALVALATSRRVLPELVAEVEAERAQLDPGSSDWIELNALLEWARARS